MKRWRSILATGLGVAVLVASLPAASPAVTDKTKQPGAKIGPEAKLPPVFEKPAPEGVSDLRAIQDHVKTIVRKVTPAVVGIQIGASSGSGVIIDSEGHVLTAGHVSGDPNNEKCWVILPSGEKLKAKSLGRNRGIDSGLMKITGKLKSGKEFPYVSMGDSGKLKRTQWVLSIGHPGGFKPTRTPVVRLGRIADPRDELICTDCTLVGGDSGGPLFDMHGRVIGIHSRIGERIEENIHVPVNAYRDSWDRLVKGDNIGGLGDLFRGRPAAPAPTVYLGLRLVPETLKIREVTKDTPAAQAGLKAGDLIVGMDSAKISNRGDLFDFLLKKKPDDEVTIVVKRDDKEVKVKLKLGKQPAE